jgi:hypothetical protein
VMFYNGYVSTRWLDVALRTELGLTPGWLPTPHVVADLSAIFKPSKHATIHTGVRVGALRTFNAVVGVAIRPTDGLEIIANATIPFASPQRYDIQGFPVRPGVSLRLWDGLGSASRTTDVSQVSSP